MQKGKDKGHCIHRFFVRGQPDLCVHMQRTKIKGHSIRKIQHRGAQQTNLPRVDQAFVNPTTLPHFQMIDHLRAATGNQFFQAPAPMANNNVLSSLLQAPNDGTSNILLQALFLQKQRELVESIVNEAAAILRR